jgi:hypothetical protein
MKELIGLALGLAALAACGNGQPVGTTTTAANVVSTDVAGRRITLARCQREVRCARIGYERTYETFDECMHQLGNSTDATLRAGVCPAGVADDRVEACADEIRRIQCEPPVLALEQQTICTKPRLCQP